MEGLRCVGEPDVKPFLAARLVSVVASALGTQSVFVVWDIFARLDGIAHPLVVVADVESVPVEVVGDT